MSEIHRRLSDLETGLKNARIISGSDNLAIGGSFRTGFAVNVSVDEAPAAVVPAAGYTVITYANSGTPDTISAEFDTDFAAYP
jgi:hypothetical protein